MNKTEQTVKQLILRYGTADPYEICEKMGVIVLEQDLPQSVNGFTVNMYNVPFAVINSSLNDDEKRITTAHELGHIVLHNGTNTVELSVNTSFCVTKFEREADCFAVYLLMYAEMSTFDGYECITADDVSKATHMPIGKVENILDSFTEPDFRAGQSGSSFQ